LIGKKISKPYKIFFDLKKVFFLKSMSQNESAKSLIFKFVHFCKFQKDFSEKTPIFVEKSEVLFQKMTSKRSRHVQVQT